MWERQVTQVLPDREFAVPPVCPRMLWTMPESTVLQQTTNPWCGRQAAGTCQGDPVQRVHREEVRRWGPQFLETASSGDVRGSESPIASTAQASSRAIRVRYGSPQVTSTVPDSRSTQGVEQGQRDRPESQGQASSGLRGWSNRFEVLAEEDGEEGPQHDEPDPPVPAIPVSRVRRVVGAFAELDVVGPIRDVGPPGRSRSEKCVARGEWKLFLLIPRLLLFRPGRGGLVPKRKLEERADRFAAGQWLSLLAESNKVASNGSTGATCRRRRNPSDETKALRAERLAFWVNCLPHGELSKEQRLHQALLRHWQS